MRQGPAGLSVAVFEKQIAMRVPVSSDELPVQSEASKNRLCALTFALL